MTRRGFTLVEIMAAVVIIAILAVITLSLGSALLERTERRRTEDMLNLLDAAVVQFETSQNRPLTCGHRGWPMGNGGDWEPAKFDAQAGSFYDIEYSNIGGGANIDFPDPLAPEFPMGTVPEAGGNGYRAKLGGEAPHFMWRELCDRLLAVESCRNILANVDPSLIEPLSTSPVSTVVPSVFRDAWGTPVLIVFPGRDVNEDLDGAPGSSGGTLRDGDGTIRTKAERILGPARNSRIYFISAGPDRRFGDLSYEIAAGEVWIPDRTEVQMRRADDNLYSYEVRTW